MQLMTYLVTLGVCGALTSIASASTYSDAVLADDPALYWRLNESAGATTAQDATASNHDGSVILNGDGNRITFGVTGPTAADGFAGFGSSNSAISFGQAADGEVDLLRSSYDVGGYGFTIEAWVKTTSGNNPAIFAAFASSSNDTRYAGSQLGQGKPNATVRNGSSTSSNYGVAINDGQWHYVAMVFAEDAGNADGNTAGTDGGDATPYVISIYVDPDDQSIPVARHYHGIQYNTSLIDRFSIGALDRSTPASQYAGEIDEVAVYASALSGEQLQNHYLAAIPEPASLALLGLGAALACPRRRRA